MNTCSTCSHCYARPLTPTYPRCDQSEAAPDDDAALCGEMRKTGPCGPDATLWEPKDG
jgi:hypothetical protein